MQKKYFYSLIAIYLLLLCCVALSVIIIDPEQQFDFDEAKIPAKQIDNSIALTVASKIKFGSFQTAILGTSSVNLFHAKNMEAILHESSSNCFIPASSYAEQKLVLNLLSEYKPTAHVIYAVDYLSFNASAQRVSTIFEE